METTKIQDRIKTLADACDYLNVKLPDEQGLSTDEVAYRKLKIIAKALNENWTPDWNNSSEYKYYPWFKQNASGGSLCCAYVYCRTAAFVGSRLCYKSSELAMYAAEQFEKEYNDFLK